MGSHGRGEGSTANGKTRTDYCRRVGGGSYRSGRSCGGDCLSETVKKLHLRPWSVSTSARHASTSERRSVAIEPSWANVAEEHDGPLLVELGRGDRISRSSRLGRFHEATMGVCGGCRCAARARTTLVGRGDVSMNSTTFHRGHRPLGRALQRPV
jgi:hypothetical protein